MDMDRGWLEGGKNEINLVISFFSSFSINIKVSYCTEYRNGLYFFAKENYVIDS